MSNEQVRVPGEDIFVRAPFVKVSEDTSLTVGQRHVVIDGTEENIAVTLPPVSEAGGRIFTVRAPNIGTDTHAATLQDADDSIGWSDLTLDADADYVVLYSDSQKWYVLLNGIA